jgi:hypothetical protein
MATTSVNDLIAADPKVTIINAGDRQGGREIRGAVRYRPSDLLEPEHLALPIDREEPVILYAEHGPTDKLREIADKLRGDGFADVRVADVTLADYEQAGGETQEASLEQVVPPMRPEQVQDLDRRL